MASRADLVIGDFNHLFGEEGGDRQAIVIVDEAHNLFDRARELYSTFVSRAAAQSVLRALRAARASAGGQLSLYDRTAPVASARVRGNMPRRRHPRGQLQGRVQEIIAAPPGQDTFPGNGFSISKSM